MPQIGQQIGNYRLMQLLGRGHWASVYLGEHLHLHTQAAIKVLHDPLAPAEMEGFLGEARTLARLRHPHIVRILDFGLQEDTPFLVMDYAPGGTLRTLHPPGLRLPLETVIPYVKQVAEALQYAHEQRLIHRDLKPENLLLGPEQQVWLADLGLALVVQSARSQPFQQTAGTLAYIAPEQLKGQPTPASDQYALGVMVYEWLCGERPFSGSFAELAVKQTLVLPPSLTKKVPTLPVGVEHVVLKALAKDPEQRFASTQAFALALEEATREEVTGHTLPVLSSASPAVAQQVSKHTLPAHLTPLLGREQEVAAACTLLRRPEVRLVTLTGTGGIGKTRLAVRIATEVLADFPDGVFFVSLAPISNPALVIPTIAQTFTLRETADQPPLEHLKTYLREKHLLLLLDNFEQVLEAAVLLTELLQACPSLKMVVTSRFVLHVSGEHEFSVPPLALPDLTQLPEIEALPQYAAVALFLQRTRAIKPQFQLTDTNARVVAEICVRLEGLPLAIELAAARVKLFHPQALLARLSQRLTVLRSGARDAPVRQQSLRNTITWSYELLNAGEQRLFWRLSVFVGGCTLEAIEAVCAAPDKSNGAGWVLDGVASLIDKSLLQQTEQEDGEPRFVMLETIREYGLERLTASGEMEDTQWAHTAYYLMLAEGAESELKGPQQVVWLERLEREHDNLRAALRWSMEQGEAGHSMERALRLGGALGELWIVHGHWSEGRTFLERALAGSEGVMASVRAKALEAAAILAQCQDDSDRAAALCEESLALYRGLGDIAGIALSLYLLGSITRDRSNFAAACSLIEESLTLYREVGDTRAIASSLSRLAWVAHDQGEYAKARSLGEESLALFKEVDDKGNIASSLFQLACVIFVQGDFATARPLLEEALALFRELADKEGIAHCFYLSGWLALSQGDAAMARSLEEESLVLYKEIGTPWGVAMSLSLLGRVAAVQGDQAAARALSQESLAFAGKGDKALIAFCQEGLAGVVAAQGEPAWAARLWGAAETLREVIRAPIPSVERANYERSVAAARERLGEQAFTTAWAEGRALSLEQALAAQGPGTMPSAAPTEPSTAPPAPRASTYPDGLTAREVEVLRLVAQGLTDAQVAEQLVISPRTVNTHLKSIYGKIQVTSRSAATRYAIEHQLL